MEEQTSRISGLDSDDWGTDVHDLDLFSELSDKGNWVPTSVSMDSILPDHLLERILVYLPVASLFRASSVCKRWHDIVTSSRFSRSLSHVLPHKPWYFMFTSSDEPTGYAYDPVFKKWYSIDLPCIRTSNWFISSSHGLVSFMDNDSRSELFVCNPITRWWRRLTDLPDSCFSDYNALAMSVSRVSQGYTISIVKSKQVPGDFSRWDLSIHIYDSETMIWVASFMEVLTGWRAGNESVICGGVLYVLLYSTGSTMLEDRHGLVTFDLSSQSSNGLLTRKIAMPCPLTCGRLVNLKDRLYMVGGIGKKDRPDVIKGIRVWILTGMDWEEAGRVPHKLFRGFGELDDVFTSSGNDELIYIQSYGGPSLLVYNLNEKKWRWCEKCPVSKRFPLELFKGFSFEPRLEIAP
ncbi:hypothetical protein MLD38_019788 [Melastoma candidum]|uniref:Uncharacterized protein n=1 Tax=Melastoma candidum TaxID=119954 RepID=A0ACB9R184_9MYRT|nr:hypothetical protein MLD38_019788 [Melastoma candidum]